MPNSKPQAVGAFFGPRCPSGHRTMTWFAARTVKGDPFSCAGKPEVATINRQAAPRALQPSDAVTNHRIMAYLLRNCCRTSRRNAVPLREQGLDSRTDVKNALVLHRQARDHEADRCFTRGLAWHR